MWCDDEVMCWILKDTEYASEEPGWCCDVCDIIIITPQPLLAGARPGPAVTSQPPLHVQGWSRLNNQILLTSKIVNWTFTKRGKGPKSPNNQNSFGAWCWLCAVMQWCLVLIMCCDAVVSAPEGQLCPKNLIWPWPKSFRKDLKSVISLNMGSSQIEPGTIRPLDTIHRLTFQLWPSVA